ncbi:hypothetical protein TMatcc_003989 [Talaromyces marneffei ATCC 18224]
MFLVAPPGTALSLVGTGWLVHRQGPVRPIVLDISTMRLRKPMKDDEILPNIRGDVGKIIHYYSGMEVWAVASSLYVLDHIQASISAPRTPSGAQAPE